MQVLETASQRARLTAALEFCASEPQVILVGSTRAGTDDFFRSYAAEHPATFGVHRFGIRELVARLAAGHLAQTERTPASRLSADALSARVAFDSAEAGELGRFEGLRAFPGFPRALRRTLGELRAHRVGKEDLAREAVDLVPLVARYERALSDSRLVDTPQLFELAREALPQTSEAVLPRVPVLLLDVATRTETERDFVEALTAWAPKVLVIRPTESSQENGGSSADRTALQRLRERLFSTEESPSSEGAEEDDDSVQLFSAPGEARECIEVVRALRKEAARGVRYDAMAVLLRTPSIYTVQLEAALRRARIPAYFARSAERPDPGGRAFLALLNCAAEGLSARRFSEYLSFAQVPLADAPVPETSWAPPDDESLPSNRDESGVEGDGQDGGDEKASGTLPAPWKWEELIVEASVIGGGAERWRRRLAGLRQELALRRDALNESEPQRARGLQREIEQLGHLAHYALPILETLAGWPGLDTWGGWLAHLTAIAPRVLRQPERVLAVLADLAPMASVGPVGLREVCEVLTPRLASLELSPPRYRYGRVFVGTPDDARARSFRVVAVPGLSERSFPQRPREDPFLLDVVRDRLADSLPRQSQRAQDERLLLRLAVGAAEERLFLSYSRIDVLEARPRVPSFYALDVSRAVRGALPDFERLEHEAAAKSDARLAWPAPRDPSEAIDAVEHDLSTLGRWLDAPPESNTKGRARYLLELNDHLARSLRSHWGRWVTREWNTADGLVRRTDSIAASLDEARLGTRTYSVSALARYAACPYRFLLASIYRIAPRSTAHSVDSLDPLTRGRLFHRVQAESLREIRQARLDGSEIDAEGVVSSTLDRVADEVRDELCPAIDRVWIDTVERIRADLRTWWRRLSADPGWEPRYFEYGIGVVGEGLDPESRPEPAVVGEGLRVRGVVDLIEASSSGTWRITDYKTGADRTESGWVIGRGEILQPLLYSLAAEKALEGTVEEGRLFFCTERGGFTTPGVVIDDRTRAAGVGVLKTIDGAIEKAHFPQAPRTDACEHCDFRPVCGPHAELRTRRKRGGVTASVDHLRRQQ